MRISLVVLLASRWPCREPACRSSLRLDFLRSPVMPHSCASRRRSPEVLPGTLTAYAAECLSFFVIGGNVPHRILKTSTLQLQLIPTTKNNPPLFDFDSELRLKTPSTLQLQLIPTTLHSRTLNIVQCRVNTRMRSRHPLMRPVVVQLSKNNTPKGWGGLNSG